MRPQDIRYNMSEASNPLIIKEQIKDYLTSQYQQYSRMSFDELQASLTSNANWNDRHQLKSCEQLGIKVQVGDICFIDFGFSYLKEAGYQHFGLILSECFGKAFVVPMTSNRETYLQAYHPNKNPLGKRHLFPLGEIKGLNKKSVLFLNDSKYINTARIIDVKAHINIESTLYKDIKQRVKECLKL